METASLFAFRLARWAGGPLGAVGISLVLLVPLVFAGWLPVLINAPSPDAAIPDPFRWGTRA